MKNNLNGVKAAAMHRNEFHESHPAHGRSGSHNHAEEEKQPRNRSPKTDDHQCTLFSISRGSFGAPDVGERQLC